MTNIDMMYMSILSVLLPTIMAGAVFRRLPTPLKILGVFIFVTFILEGCTFVFYQFSYNNMALFHVYTYLEFFSISLIYFVIFKENKIIQWIIVICALIFAVISLLNQFLGSDIATFNSIQRVIEYGFLLLYFILYLSKVIANQEAPFLELHPYFIMTVGFLIYFTGTLLLFLSVNKLEEWGVVELWMIHGILNILLNIAYFVTLWNGSKMVQRLS